MVTQAAPVSSPATGSTTSSTLLAADGRRVVGPTVVDGAIVDDELTSAAQLPCGWTAETGPGSYRLVPSGRDAGVRPHDGPTSAKRSIHPPLIPLTRGRRVDGVGQDRGDRRGGAAHRPHRRPGAATSPPSRIQERAMRAGPLGDADHDARRATPPSSSPSSARRRPTRASAPRWAPGRRSATGPTSPCPSSTTGIVVRAGTPAGEAIVDRLALRPADDRAASRRPRSRSPQSGPPIGDPVPTAGLPERLRASLDHPHWAEVAERCLACANCTLVCPTCFCTSVTVASDLDGVEATTDRAVGQLLQPRLRPGRRGRQLPTEGPGPLPPVADPQVLDLVGPVRLVRLRRLRTLHRLVPGRDRRPGRAHGDRPADRHDRGDGLAAIPLADRPGRGPRAGRARARRARPPPHGPRRRGRRETADTATHRPRTADPDLLAARPGQFVMVELPGFAVPPISISRIGPASLDLTIRSVGPATAALTALADRRRGRPARSARSGLAPRRRPSGATS